MRIEKKTWPEYFQLILDGKKTYDLRVADFQCQEGDILVLREWDPETQEYTGRELEKTVTYVGKTGEMSFWNKDEVENHGLQCMALKPDVLAKDIFAKEIVMCQKHYQKKQRCAWGECDNCGVLPLLVKLHEGRLVETEEEIARLKADIFEKID